MALFNSSTTLRTPVYRESFAYSFLLRFATPFCFTLSMISIALPMIPLVLVLVTLTGNLPDPAEATLAVDGALDGERGLLYPPPLDREVLLEEKTSSSKGGRSSCLYLVGVPALAPCPVSADADLCRFKLLGTLAVALDVDSWPCWLNCCFRGEPLEEDPLENVLPNPLCAGI